MFGKYRLLHRLGAGRSGTVWLAVHLGLEEYRAIKCVSRKCADYETFRREALILKELQHPGIPQIYDLEEDSEYFYCRGILFTPWLNIRALFKRQMRSVMGCRSADLWNICTLHINYPYYT